MFWLKCVKNPASHEYESTLIAFLDNCGYSLMLCITAPKLNTWLVAVWSLKPYQMLYYVKIHWSILYFERCL